MLDSPTGSRPTDRISPTDASEFALEELLQHTCTAPLDQAEQIDTAIDEYLAFNLNMRDTEKPRMRIMLMRFVDWLRACRAEGADLQMTTVRDLTTANVLSFLSQRALFSQR